MSIYPFNSKRKTKKNSTDPKGYATFMGKLVSTGNTQTGKSENAVQVRNSSPSPNGLKIKYAYRMR